MYERGRNFSETKMYYQTKVSYLRARPLVVLKAMTKEKKREENRTKPNKDDQFVLNCTEFAITSKHRDPQFKFFLLLTDLRGEGILHPARVRDQRPERDLSRPNHWEMCLGSLRNLYLIDSMHLMQLCEHFRNESGNLRWLAISWRRGAQLHMDR